jgi:subtilase family serine protease
VCVEVALPTSGQHTLATVIDGPRQLAEYNETNNVYIQPYQATGPAAPATPTPGAARPDLTVSAVKVNDRVPDGKDDCKEGKNTVTVVVRNGGPVDASDFNVQLVADDAQGAALRQSVDDGLGAGKEVAVTFGGVRLKQGPHILTATADATTGTGTGIAESNEANNTLKVAVRCSDDD